MNFALRHITRQKRTATNCVRSRLISSLRLFPVWRSSQVVVPFSIRQVRYPDDFCARRQRKIKWQVAEARPATTSGGYLRGGGLQPEDGCGCARWRRVPRYARAGANRTRGKNSRDDGISFHSQIAALSSHQSPSGRTNYEDFRKVRRPCEGGHAAAAD